MINIWELLVDRVKGKAPKGARRSGKWRKVRKDFLAKNPCCEICGTTTNLTVHHVVPFHIAPDLELNSNNFMVLCENKKYGINCHLLVGHIGNFRKVNPEARFDAKTWHHKIKD